MPGKAWRIPISTLDVLIASPGPDGRCVVEVWSVGSKSSAIPDDLQLYLLLQSGWCDSIPIDPPSDPGSGSGAGRAWRVSVAALNLLRANHDSNNTCRVEVWTSNTRPPLPSNLELWLFLQTGWCDSIPIDPPAANPLPASVCV